MAGIIGKIRMTSVYSAEGKNLPCDIEAGPCVVTQIKHEKDGYESTQLGLKIKEKNTPKACLVICKAKTTPKEK